MRTIEETSKRWKLLFLHNDTASDLLSVLRGEQCGKLCKDGLRSICWKIFLLFEDLDRDQWSQKIAESRDTYSALRAHFLNHAEQPDNVELMVDPLADDEQSPWQTLRNDEKLRIEISQDVDRCLQENIFFQEPATKTKLIDILFVYSKLNPDVGYRQGMHELLAPLLWVLDLDSVQRPSCNQSNKTGDGDEGLMLDLLDHDFVEHDSFALFLRVMDTARIYYEHSETKSEDGQFAVIPIVRRCQYLHHEALMIIDPELAEHLQAVDVLPQIFLTRWMRLLFGREFSFDDVLTMWDILFSHGLRSDLVDFTCIAMLLRIRWPLLKADYSSALSMLLRYPSPKPHAPGTFVHDALYLEQNPTAERGSSLIAKYSGKQPELTKRRTQSGARSARRAYLWEDFRSRSESNSPARSLARNSPKSLEALFQDVSQGIQRRTESWSVAKAVRGAVTEARRNMQTMHHEPNARRTATAPKTYPAAINSTSELPKATEMGLEEKIGRLEERSMSLSRVLGEALNDIRSHFSASTESGPSFDSAKQALSRVESVQECLADPSLLVNPLQFVPEVDSESGLSALPPKSLHKSGTESKAEIVAQQDHQDEPHLNAETPGPSIESGTFTPAGITTSRRLSIDDQADKGHEAPRSTVRPSLSDAEFSWMLEGSRNVSSFVSSASVPPEQTRHQDLNRSKGNALFGNNGDEQRKPETDHDQLALRSLRGTRGPL